jgi:hypothetical protein
MNSVKNLRAFMREVKEPEKIVRTLGPETMTDENGERIMLELRVLSFDEISRIVKAYTTKTIARDEKGKVIFASKNEVALVTSTDDRKISNHSLVESFITPNMKDPELMKHFNCVSFVDMPSKMFTKEELVFMFDIYNKVQAGEEIEPEEADEIIGDIKN